MSVETKLTAPDQANAPPSRDRAVLVIYESEEGGASTRVVELPDRALFTIGRSRSASLRTESERVSRLHARFERRGAELFVEDAGSRNGTWVNGEQITGSHLLKSGDEVVVGPVTVVVSITTNVVERARIESPRILEERLAAEVDRARRYQRKLSLVMLDMQGSAAVTDDACDRVSSRLRAMDTIIEYAPSLHAIVLPEIDGVDVEEMARDLVRAARAPEVAAAVGVASYPQHGTTVGALIGRARAAVEAAGTDDVVGVPPEDPDPSGGPVVVVDPQMRRVFELVRKVADHPITVLVLGETGVGKEVIAGAIHAGSSRRRKPLVRLNCASLPEPLLESELFGHEKGAFTGADRRKQGYFEAAHGGTLFLDEIGEMSATLQAKLLRVLEERKFTRVGGTEEIEVDVRVVCATHRDLEAASKTGAFRSDLFFRISAFTILVPPLRDRPDEIVELARHFIRETTRKSKARAPGLSQAAAAAMRRYAWPGNVRELRNAIDRAVVLHSGGTIELEDLPDRVREGRASSTSMSAIEDRVATLERDAIVAALDAAGGNQTIAAKSLGLSRRTLIYRMEKHGLKPPPDSRKA